MPTNHSTDAPNLASIPTITVYEATTGLPCVVPLAALRTAQRTGQPIVLTVWPNDQADPDPPPMSEVDEVIAEIIDQNHGCTKDDIYRLAESRYGMPMGTDALKNRMRKGGALRGRGYHVRGRQYYPPEV